MKFIKLFSNVVRNRGLLDLNNIKGVALKSSIDLETLIMDMPTEKTNPRPKPRISHFSSANVTLQVLGCGAQGSPASLYVFTDQSRYLFNCGEGTQRLAHEHKIKLSKLEHIFITHSSWKNFGGLPGMCLTLQDSGVSDLVLHGPPQIEDIFWATKRFVVLRDLTVAKADQLQPFEDAVMKVEYVLLNSDNAVPTDKISEMANYNNEADEKTNSKRIRLDAPEKKVSVGYICRLHAKPGTLRLDLCEEQGVPLGPLLGQLKAGKDVTLDNGKVVHSRDVTTPEEPGPIFIVLECPDISYLPSLIGNEKLAAHQALPNVKETDLASAVIHFSAPDVVCTPEYQAWMNKFSPSATQLILNSSSTCQGLLAVHRLQHKLHLLHPEIFPPLTYRTKPAHSTDMAAFATQAETLDKFYLRPRKGLDRSSNIIINVKEYIDEVMAQEGFVEEHSKLEQSLIKHSESVNKHPVVSFLGTGSCIPNKTRNTSGMLLEISDGQNMLLDCGEGTYGQMVRLLSQAGVEGALCNLQSIFISHLHADHHIGLVAVLQARRQAFDKLLKEHTPLLLLAPSQIAPWLSVYDSKFETIADQYKLVRLGNMVDEESVRKEVEAALGFSNIKVALVKHCPNAFGIALEHEKGWKLVYSGDTEPCEELIEIGRGCDVLIHEATMEDGLEAEARKKKHSTTSEAIEVGRKMDAKFTLLTHFSQRYSKIPLFNEKFTSNIGIAFDNMRVPLNQLKILSLLFPSLRIMFDKYYEEMEQKTKHHQIKQAKLKNLR